MPWRAALLVALVVLAAFLAVGFSLLDEYGPTWDCASGEYPHGELYLAYYLSGDAQYLDFPPPAKMPEFRQPHLDYSKVDVMSWPQAYPFTAVLSALSCRVLWTWLGVVPPLEAHNLPVLLFAGLLLFGLTALVAARFGVVAALGTALALTLSPRFFAHSFNNLKDIPEAFLYVLAILSAYQGFRTQKLGYWVLTGVVAGFALAQKPNALFIPVHGLALWVCCNLTRLVRRRRLLAFPVRGLAVAIPVFLAAYFACHPMLWTDTKTHLLMQYGFIRSVGTNQLTNSLDGLLHVLWTTPPAILLLALPGLFSRRLNADERWILLLGVVVPVGRTALPGMANFDGVRHFIEFYPFLAMLAGVGLAATVDVLLNLLRLRSRRRVWRGGATAVIVIACFLWPARQVIATHPNGICYFNCLIGGLKGAQDRRLPEATDYWCHSYLQGLRWISEHGEQDSAVLVSGLETERVARVIAPLVLRADITFCDPYDLPSPTALYVMYTTRWQYYGDLAKALDGSSVPVHQIDVQGAPILKIHRITGPAEIAAALRTWAECRAFRRLGLWLYSHQYSIPGAPEAIERASRSGFDKETLEQLEPYLDPEVRRDVELAVRYR